MADSIFPVLDWSDCSSAVRAGFRARVLAGDIFVLPTETVYGLGGDATSDEACGRIFAAKGRPSDNPLIVHFADFAAMRPYVGKLSDLETRLAESFMPGPFTMILPHLAGICATARAGGDTVAVRVPEHPIAREILAYLGVSIAAPSANPSGRPSATTAAMARGYFPQIDHVWDGGDCGYGLESTVVRVTGDTVRILRPGYIGREDIERILLPHERAVYGSAEAGETTVPGAKYRHYAPKAHICLLDSSADTDWADGDETSKSALIASEEYCRTHANLLATRPGMGVEIWWSQHELPLLAHKLYSLYDRLDREGYARIWIEPVSDRTGLGRAIMNRIEKSALRR